MALARWKDLCPDSVDPAAVAPFWAGALPVAGPRRPALVREGATVLRAPDGDIEWHVLADPAGNELCVFAP